MHYFAWSKCRYLDKGVAELVSGSGNSFVKLGYCNQNSAMILYYFLCLFYPVERAGDVDFISPNNRVLASPDCLCQKKNPILSPGNANFQTHSSLHSDKTNLIPYSSGLLSLSKYSCPALQIATCGFEMRITPGGEVKGVRGEWGRRG